MKVSSRLEETRADFGRTGAGSRSCSLRAAMEALSSVRFEEASSMILRIGGNHLVRPA